MFKLIKFQAQRRRILFLWIVLGSIICSAQKTPIKFGTVPIEDLKMETYENDSSAAALILADFGESSMAYSEQKGFALRFQRIIRIKILKKEGLEWGNFTIPLYHNSSGSEKVTELKGITHNLENGNAVQTKMKNDAVFREEYDDNNDFTKVALPNVKVGSVVDLTYEISSDFIFNFQDWSFQSTIPTRWSEYRTKIPEYFSYDKYMQGYIVPSINEQSQQINSFTISSTERSGGRVERTQINNDRIEFQENVSRWAAKDVPAFKEEPYLTTYKDYISKINFELASTKFPNQPPKYYMGSWKDINDTFLESDLFGDVVTGNGHLKDNVEQLTAGVTSAEEKIGILHQYVRDNFLWNGASRKYASSPLRKVIDEKKGSSAEINLLLASMLEKAGVEVYPVLISTRDNGFVRESLPISSQFNYAICLAKIGEKQILLDATQKLLPTGLLPERCLNGQGLVVSKAGHAWVSLTAPLKSRISKNADLVLNEEGVFSGKVSIDRTGYYAEQGRKKYFSKDESDYVKEFVGNRPWQITKSNFENPKQLSYSFKETHEVSIADYITVAGDMVYFNPFFIDRIEENQFKLEKREYPVDFGRPFDQVHFSKITIPDGYTVEELPTAKAFALPNNGGKYLFNATKIGNSITINSTLQINQSLFSQDEYPGLREFYAMVVAKQAEQVVLKKK